MTTPDDVIAYWFPDAQDRANAIWWGKDPEIDAEISARFGDTLRAAKAGELDAWASTARGRLALIVVLDQLSRNIHRGDPETYAADAQARAHAEAAIELGQDLELPPRQRMFVYMPLEHAEDLAAQDHCVERVRALAQSIAADPLATPEQRELFASYVDYAIAHRDIIARFGRFPHRNELLGRESTDEEREFLTQPGSSF